MQILDALRQRFATALSQLFAESDLSDTDSSETIDLERFIGFAQMVRPTTDSRHGDYQANCAMPLGKLLSENPRAVAEKLLQRLKIDDLCIAPEIAGPGFINLRIRDDYLSSTLGRLLQDKNLGVSQTPSPKTIIVDFSSPNVAKPMHVGHIRSTVIGDALSKVLRFLGHNVITDNHLGDWGTQFGMIIYGFKNFGDEVAFRTAPVAELTRLYKLVNRLIDYHNAVATIEPCKSNADEFADALEQSRARLAATTDSKAKKQAEKALQSLHKKCESIAEQLEKLTSTIAALESDPESLSLAKQHTAISAAVLQETAKLHESDETNLALWHRFLPFCKDEINRVYERLNVSFDHTLGESFYHPMLEGVVAELRAAGLATDSEGAVCVFLDGFESPMIIQKRDGAFLYSTTDLATLVYRRENFKPDEVLYVVDTRQSEHFEKLFAAARMMGLSATRLVHVNFGTVLGDDGKPFKTRSGTSIGLESLLDDAVSRAFAVVCNPERSARVEPSLDEAEIRLISRVVGHGAIKYADLSHHRTSDYKFDLEKMVSLDGNTSAYVQYAYARVQGILARGETNELSIVSENPNVVLGHLAERALALQLLRFGECLEQVWADYAPNFLVDYLYETAKAYAVFNDGCPVLKAEDKAIMKSRLAIVASTGRVLRQGLNLLGIDVVPRM